MKVKALLSCLIMAILGLYSITASAAWQCTAWNPTLHLRWTSDISGSRWSASDEVSTECESITNYREAGECYTTCSTVSSEGRYNHEFYSPRIYGRHAARIGRGPVVIINGAGSGLGQATIPATTQICSVRDRMGRMWNRTSYTQNACSLALDACMNSHTAHGIYNGKCWVVR
jgi:hypothetical protein